MYWQTWLALFLKGEDMDTTVLTAVLALVGTLAGTFGGILTSTKLTNYRIEQLEKRFEKISSFAEKITLLEGNDKLLHEKIEVANHRIADLESKVG